MTEIRIIAGSWATGVGTYKAGLFTMPGGAVRGVEDLMSMTTQGEVSDEPHWAGQIVGGLRGALAAAVRLPRPLGLAASTVTAGLGAIGDGLHRRATLEAAFADGSTLVAVTEAGVVSLIRNDREVVCRAQARSALPSLPTALPAGDTGDDAAFRARGTAADAADAALTSIFEYEKRNGRLRRVPNVQGPGKRL